MTSTQQYIDKMLMDYMDQYNLTACEAVEDIVEVLKYDPKIQSGLVRSYYKNASILTKLEKEYLKLKYL